MSEETPLVAARSDPGPVPQFAATCRAVSGHFAGLMKANWFAQVPSLKSMGLVKLSPLAPELL